MPCYLFTYHAYGSWMPDRKKGYVRRKQGVLAADVHMAQCYRRNLADGSIVEFSEQVQKLVLFGILDGCKYLSVQTRGVACDASHIHCLISWRHDRPWQRVSESIKRRMTLDLNKVQQRKWLSKGGSRKRVKDRRHFEYLVISYLPRHRGVTWFEGEPTPGES